ncbi:hypothetical protein PENSPDRAFT_109288 [Peniophora sp. CONT]|nr:hypothetical protein PENSPDRAFT_109288 [Peniophora sp. CONT]
MAVAANQNLHGRVKSLTVTFLPAPDDLFPYLVPASESFLSGHRSPYINLSAGFLWAWQVCGHTPRLNFSCTHASPRHVPVWRTLRHSGRTLVITYHSTGPQLAKMWTTGGRRRVVPSQTADCASNILSPWPFVLIVIHGTSVLSYIRSGAHADGPAHLCTWTYLSSSEL